MTAGDVRIFFVACLPFALLPLDTAHAQADNQEEAVDTVVVTASRLGGQPSNLSQSVEIITRDQIESRQAPNVTELLRQVAGLNVIQQGGRGGVTSVVLRGGEANFTVVLIDGVKVNDPTNTRGGSYDFSFLDISNIERIEIVRGPMSALYGSDALSGVINVITRRGAGNSRISLEAGGHGLRSGMLALGGQYGALDASMDMHALQESGGIEGSDYEDRGVDAGLRYRLDNDARAGVTLRFTDADSTSFPEDSGGPEFAAIRDVDQHDVTESHARAYLDRYAIGDWQAGFALSRYERDENFTSPGVAPGVFDGVPPNSADTEFSRDQAVATLSKDLTDTLSLAAGAEFQRESGTSTGIIDFGFPVPTDFSLRRDTASVFLESGLQFRELQLQASLRWDDPDRIKGELSAQFGAVYHLSGGDSALRFNWGQGFKAPSFLALAHPLIGNPELRSETAESVDAGYWIRAMDQRLRFDISLFRNVYKDLIDFDPVLFTNVNRSKVVTQGMELTTDFEFSESLKLSGHLSYLEADIRDSSAQLRGRPRWRGGVILDWEPASDWQLVTSVLMLDDFHEVSIATGGLTLDGYTRVDTALKYSLHENVEFGVAIDNLLDEEYHEAVGFPAAGRRARVNVTYWF